MEKQKIIEIIAERLIGHLPVHKGPFVSNGEARRLAHYDNKKRFDLAEELADVLMIDEQAEARERVNKAKEYIKNHNNSGEWFVTIHGLKIAANLKD